MAAPPIAVLFGTRPEAIKLAPVIVELRSRGVPTLVVATGQHRDIVGQVLDLFDIQPDHDLALMKEGQTLDHVLSSVISGVGALLADARPRAMLVQGDTTSTLGGAIAAFHHKVPVGHVEAGLRSGSLDLPFPEEMNRRVTSIVTRWHFPPTEGAAANLRREGIEDGIVVTGNTVVDALRHIGRRAAEATTELAAFAAEGPLILATAHRRESWGGGIERIAAALSGVLDALPDHRLVFATHPNPVASDPVRRVLGDEPRARVVTALDYPEFVGLLGRARLAITDSGGVQEEGPTLGVPVLVTREVTERPEGVDAGAVILVGTDPDRIRTLAVELLTDGARHESMASRGRGIYGDGRASERIVDRLVADLSAVP
ncbi:MAG TPA: UDP-N-acetylglucosamine 2-epimerase (non-hydrolyzing) [Candidatus Limnocylindria bacterium]